MEEKLIELYLDWFQVNNLRTGFLNYRHIHFISHRFFWYFVKDFCAIFVVYTKWLKSHFQRHFLESLKYKKLGIFRRKSK